VILRKPSPEGIGKVVADKRYFHVESLNPPILHRKELLPPEADPAGRRQRGVSGAALSAVAGTKEDVGRIECRSVRGRSSGASFRITASARLVLVDPKRAPPHVTGTDSYLSPRV